jgi:phosphoglucomutase
LTGLRISFADRRKTVKNRAVVLEKGGGSTTMKDYKKIYEEWLSNPYFDEETKEELRAIADNENEIKERFYMDLEFGTAGLRGVIGAGINRMNIYVVRRATQGLANYIIKQGGASKGVAIAYDSRHMSPEFADEAARTLAANGIVAYKFESLRPTPELSFAVRELGCIAGINVTASHNPPEYNGYKVYWEDGAQFTPPHDKGVTEEVLAIEDLSTVKTMSASDAKAAGLYKVIGAEIDDKYIAHVKAQVVNQDAIDKMQDDIKIVYTPLHGTGNIPVRRVLKEIGFTHVYVVPEQELPDGDFPTVSYPNPEAAEAFALGLGMAKKLDADLVLATDPDADRLGVYVKDSKSGEYIPLTGNMSGSLLCEYVLSQKAAKNAIPEDGEVVKSIVTTNLVDAVADYYHCKLVECLTGFKWIGKQILKEEQTGKGHYMFGLEESYGCLIGTYARDKDAVSASVALCEAAAYYKTRNMTLWDAMVAMYEKYGYYKDAVKAIGLKGIEGLAKIQNIMETLRKEAPAKVGEYDVVSARDYKLDTIKDMKTGAVTETGLPASNVLYYDLNDGAWVCVRPSGTEPKIKFYYGVKGTSLEDADKKSAELGEALMAMVDKML